MPGKIVFLTKRRPMGRDLFSHPYGRFYYLPRELADLGYEVTVIAVSYRAGENSRRQEHGLNWESVSIRPGVWSAFRSIEDLIAKAAPNWIVGCSDTYFGILAERIATKIGCLSVIDAYDNYCSYIPWAKPLHMLWNRAIARCDLTTVAGPSLAELWAPQRGAKGSVIIPMAADPSGFFLRDRFRARSSLGLPVDVPIVGYSGSISPQRGIETLFEAIAAARKRHPRLTLALSGRLSQKVKLPPHTIYLGYLPNAAVPIAINSFDVMAVINRDSSFGNYSFPVKLYEAMACKVPVIASRTRSTDWILADQPESLVEPGNALALSAAIVTAMERGRVNYPVLPTWPGNARIFDQALTRISPKPS